MFESLIYLLVAISYKGQFPMENQMFNSIVMAIVCQRSSESSYAEIHNP